MRREKRAAFAAKPDMNLAFREEQMHPAALIAALLAILAAAFLVARFGVLGRMEAVAREEAEVSALGVRLAGLQEACADYDEVEREYNRYTYSGYDRTLADRLDVLSLLEREVFPVCGAQRLSMSGRQVSLTLEGLDLESTSALIASLRADDLVEDVSVSTYNGDAGTKSPSTITQMTITLAVVQTEQTGEGAA